MLKYSGNGFSSAGAEPGGVAGGAAAVTVAGGLLLVIRLRFHNHAPQQLAIRLALHQQAADQLGGDHLGRATTSAGRAKNESGRCPGDRVICSRCAPAITCPQ